MLDAFRQQPPVVLLANTINYAMAKLRGTAAEPSDIKALGPSIGSSKDASSLPHNNGEIEAHEAQADDEDDSQEDKWSSSDEEDLPVVDNPIGPQNIKVFQLFITLTLTSTD